jgi:hypothetical protein
VLGVFRHPAFLAAMGAAAVVAAVVAYTKSLAYKQTQMDRINTELIDEYRMLDYLKDKHGPDADVVKKQEDNISNLEWKKSDLESEISTMKKNDDGTTIGDRIDKLSSFFSMPDPFSDFSLNDSDLSKLEQIPDINVSEDMSDIKIGEGANLDNIFKNMLDSKFTTFNREEADALAYKQGRMAEGELQRLPQQASPAQNVTTPSRPSSTVEMPTLENNDTKMQNRMTTAVPKVQNNTTNLSQGSDKIPLKRKIPAVRNTEESYSSTIAQNVRMPN